MTSLPSPGYGPSSRSSRRRLRNCELYTDGDFAARDCVATLHLYAGRHPEDPQFTELIGELSPNSTAFRRLWSPGDSIRWEIRDDVHEAFITLGCAIICWRRLRDNTLGQLL